MKKLISILFILSLLSCHQNENVHQDPTHNFTVYRLIILNDKNEMLMSSEESVWAAPFLLFNQRQFLQEGLNDLAKSYGIKTTVPKLHGYFSYKYEYHPYATLRSYFVAHYISGEIKVPENMGDAQWMPIPEAIEKNSVTSIKQITEQIIKFPNTVWGGSFLVSRTDGSHPTKIVEPFYPLFQSRAKE